MKDFEKEFEKEFKFLDTPKFSYEYRNEVQILGRKLIHIGEGIFMFEEPFVSDELSLDQFREKLADYRDISFIRFYTYSYDGGDQETWIIPFAVSATHGHHDFEDIAGCDREYMAGFNIPDSMKGIINNIVENYLENDKVGHIVEEIHYNKDVFNYRPFDDECTHLLDPKHNTDDGRYLFVNGFVGRKILEGIYYFDGSVLLSDDRRMGRFWEDDKCRPRARDLQPDDFKDNIAFIDKIIFHGGLVEIYSLGDYSIYYLAIGDSAIGVLSRLYKYLSGYEMHFMGKDAVMVKNEPVDLMAYLGECERKRKELNGCPIHIPEGARELIDGKGFHDLDVRCELLFQNIGRKDNTNSRGFRKYDVAYILDERLYLINYNLTSEKEQGYVLDLRMVSELSVRYKVRLFDPVEEDIVQVVIDNRNAERLIIGEENFGTYLDFVTKES